MHRLSLAYNVKRLGEGGEKKAPKPIIITKLKIYNNMSNEKQNPASCQTAVSGSFSSECNQNFKPTHSFKDGKYYRDENYFGDVIYSDEKMIQVECKNGNKYMEGQIITMKLVGS
jgi:hypothetical protein